MTKAKKKRVACVVCGRMIVAKRDGHPRNHIPSNRLVGKRGASGFICAGVSYVGDKI